MSIASLEAKRAAIRTNLFLLCPNNSGSTYLGAAIRRSRNVWGFDSEGQHVIGFAGPHTRGSPWALIWGNNPEARAHFEDAEYDWERTKKAWYFHAESASPDAAVFFTKSPPFLLIAEQLRQNFEDTKFVFMVRNPYAMLEGIVRRHARHNNFETRTELVETAARHIVTCFEVQARNCAEYADISCRFTYEELCENPCEMAARIEGLVPALDDLDLAQRLAVKGQYDEPLRNMNADQIARLSDQDIAEAAAIFAHHEDRFDTFGYSIDARC